MFLSNSVISPSLRIFLVARQTSSTGRILMSFFHESRIPSFHLLANTFFSKTAFKSPSFVASIEGSLKSSFPVSFSSLQVPLFGRYGKDWKSCELGLCCLENGPRYGDVKWCLRLFPCSVSVKTVLLKTFSFLPIAHSCFSKKCSLCFKCLPFARFIVTQKGWLSPLWQLHISFLVGI